MLFSPLRWTVLAFSDCSKALHHITCSPQNYLLSHLGEQCTAFWWEQTNLYKTKLALLSIPIFNWIYPCGHIQSFYSQDHIIDHQWLTCDIQVHSDLPHPLSFLTNSWIILLLSHKYLPIHYVLSQFIPFLLLQISRSVVSSSPIPAHTDDAPHVAGAINDTSTLPSSLPRSAQKWNMFNPTLGPGGCSQVTSLQSDNSPFSVACHWLPFSQHCTHFTVLV